MEFVVEGKAYWAFTHKPFELADQNYQVMLVPDAETMARFEDRGQRVQDIKINHDKTLTLCEIQMNTYLISQFINGHDSKHNVTCFCF